jgi:hypothetical protein
MKPMSDKARAALNAKNEEFTDWRGKCRRCGAELTGSLKQLREHSCGEPS